jgi:hypothetical protein
MTMQLSGRSWRRTGTADHRAGALLAGLGKPWRAVGWRAGDVVKALRGVCRGIEWVKESRRRWPERK